MSKRRGTWAEQDPYLDEDEDPMRCEKHYSNQYGAKIDYLIGPTQPQAKKIADVLRREGDREGATDNLKLEEGLMRAMAGQSAQATVCVQGMAKKVKDQVTRCKPHMAVGPVYTKANEMEMHIRLLTNVGGKPGDSWGAVAELSNFTGAVVKVVSRKGSKKPMSEKEGERWISQMQAALDPEAESGEDALKVWARWKDHLKHVAPTAKRVAGLDKEQELKETAADRYGDPRQLWRR